MLRPPFLFIHSSDTFLCGYLDIWSVKKNIKSSYVARRRSARDSNTGSPATPPAARRALPTTTFPFFHFLNFPGQITLFYGNGVSLFFEPQQRATFFRGEIMFSRQIYCLVSRVISPAVILWSSFALRWLDFCVDSSVNPVCLLPSHATIRRSLNIKLSGEGEKQTATLQK